MKKAQPEDERIKPKRVCSTKGCNMKIASHKRKKSGEFQHTTCAGCVRRSGKSNFNRIPPNFKKMNWWNVVKDRDGCMCWRTLADRKMMMDADGNCKHCGRKIHGMD
jgi:hypothetical protein